MNEVRDDGGRVAGRRVQKGRGTEGFLFQKGNQIGSHGTLSSVML